MLKDPTAGRAPSPSQSPALYRTFVISLERAFERRAHMRRLIRRLGLSAEFVSAVDGLQLTAQERARYDGRAAQRVYGCDMNDREIACVLSLLQIFERMDSEKIEAALIFEDDMDCDDDLAFLAGQLCALPAADWLLIRLETLKLSVEFPKSRRRLGRPIAHVAGRTLTRLSTGTLGAGAYLIRRPAAQALLWQARRIFMPIDQMMERYWENGLPPMIVRPTPAWQSQAFVSLIGLRGRANAVSAGISQLLMRRWQRAADSFDKCMFWIALKAPVVGSVLAAAGVGAARIGLRLRRLARANRPGVPRTSRSGEWFKPRRGSLRG